MPEQDGPPHEVATNPEGRPARLALRPPAESDVEALVELRGDSSVRRHLGGPVGRADALAKARDLLDSEGHFVVEMASGDVAGLVSLTPRGDEVELSFEFFPRYWGQGVAHEACSALLVQAAEAGQHSRLVAITQAANEDSKRLLDALGFEPREELEEFGAVQVLFVLHR